MLQLYDKNKNKIEGLTKYKDLKIESELSNGDKTLSFLYPTKFCKNIVEEGYIQTKTDEFVIKEISKNREWNSIKAVLNIENLEGAVFEDFDSTEQTIQNCLNLALVGTGWTCQVNGVTKKRTVRKTNSSAWDIIQQAKKTYRVEIKFDTINKIVKVYEKIGSDKGAYFTEELNLKSLDIQSNSYDFFTRMIAKGKDDLKVIVENYQYSNKVKTCIWKDERYTDVNSLREDAILKLDELSKPYRAYKADVIDLARISEKYKNILDYSLGDTITLISKDNGIKEKQRIVKITEYPDEPEKNTVEIANTTLTFEDVQKEFQDTSEVVNNITADDGTISEAALRVPIERLTINKVDVQELNAVTARVGSLEATKANITELNAVNANLTNLIAGKADITDLTATNIKFNVGSGNTLDLQTLLSKFVTGENGEFLNITSSNTTIANAVIKDAMIENLSLNKLKAGTINTNNINLASADGGLSIVGPTMQFKDSSNKVRLQLGQDTAGDFNFILRAADGTTTLIDGYGIKEKAIADKLIKSNMVADGAIGEQQINYSSLITGLNKDTNTSLIKASKVALDLTGQSLEVSFNSLKSNVDSKETRNLILNSDIPVIKEANSNPYTFEVFYRNLEPNTTYTFSANVEVLEGQTDVIDLRIHRFADNTHQRHITTNIVNGRILATFNTNEQTGYDLLVYNGKFGRTQNNTIKYEYYKLEKGENSNPTWTPAPEDIEEKIEANTTAITVAQGQISGLISENTIIKGDITTISNDYTSLSATVNGINTTVASHTSSIGSLTTDLDTVSGKVTTVENKQATLEQNLEGFKATVSNTYSTKTELNDLSGTVSSINSRVSTAESSINQLNNKIALKVEQTDIEEAINALEIGGANLLTMNDVRGRRTTDFVKNGYDVTFTHKSDYDGFVIYNLRTMTELNKLYVLSFKIKKNSGTFINIGGHYDGGQIRIDNFYVDDVKVDLGCLNSGYTLTSLDDGNWHKVAIYFTRHTDAEGDGNDIDAKNRIIPQVNRGNSTVVNVTVKDIKIEKGNKVTSWSPAPEDTDNAITAVDGRVTTLNTSLTTVNNKVATIETNLNAITSRVSSTENSITTINGNISSLQTRMSSAEQKITDSAIINTVSSTILNAVNAVDTNNLLLDGSFENNGYGWTGSGTIVTDGIDGGKCLKLTAEQVKRLNKFVDVIPGEKYKMSFWYKTSSDNNGTSDNQKMRLGKTDGSLLFSLWAPPSETWTYREATYTIPSGVYTIEVSLGTNTTAGWIYYDKVSFVNINDVADLQDRVSSVDTKVTTINNKVATIETNLDSITSRVSSTESSITTINGNISSLQTRMSSAEQKITDTAIVSTVRSSTSYQNDLNAKASKTDVSSLSDTVSSINSRVSTAESSITQLNNQIVTKVEATEVNSIVNTAVNGIEIGGRNLLLNSYEIVTPNYETDGDNYSYYGDRSCDLIAGETYIVKGICPSGLNWSDRHPVIGSTNAVLFLLGENGSHKMISSNTTGTTGTTFTVSVSQRYTLRTNVYKAGQYTFSKIKIEKGNKATDWTPAPEDIDKAITAVDTKINTTDNKVATIETSLNSITSRVSSTESSITTINGNISSLQTRMSSAEEKITDSAIINTVSSTFLTKDDAASTYATKSLVTQTANQVKMDFSSSGGYNFVKNSNFQSGTAYWDKVGTPSIFAVGKYRANGYGENVLALTTTANGQQVSQLVEGLQVGRTYTISCFIYIENGSMCIMESNTWNGAYTKGTGWQWISFSFIPNATSVIIFIGSNEVATSGAAHIAAVSLTEGSERLAWTPHPNEVYSGNTIIDARGVTIYNGALTIKNKSNQEVLKADDNGNLLIRDNGIKISNVGYVGESTKQEIEFNGASMTFTQYGDFLNGYVSGTIAQINGSMDFFASDFGFYTNSGDGAFRVNGDIYNGSYSNDSNGYTKLPNGFILQWGEFLTPGINANDDITPTITLPISFPTRMLLAMPYVRKCLNANGEIVYVETSIKEVTIYTASTFGPRINAKAYIGGGVVLGYIAIGY